MMTSSNGNIFRVTGLCAGNSPFPGEFPAQRPVTQSFDVFLDLRLNKRLSKQSRGWWFETPSRSLLRQRNVMKEGLDVFWQHHCLFRFAMNILWMKWLNTIYVDAQKTYVAKSSASLTLAIQLEHCLLRLSEHLTTCSISVMKHNTKFEYMYKMWTHICIFWLNITASALGTTLNGISD